MNEKRSTFRLDSRTLKVCIAVLLLLFTVALFTINYFIRQGESRYNAARSQAAALEQKKDDLTDRIGNLGTPEGVEQIAGDELGLGKPGSVQIPVK